jgi:O-acetylhomoserine/O-acetylserine sulfhydrylase-like pyridoxal-dependent enzyme
MNVLLFASQSQMASTFNAERRGRGYKRICNKTKAFSEGLCSLRRGRGYKRICNKTKAFSEGLCSLSLTGQNQFFASQHGKLGK